jgi:hypothetical protein
MQQPTLRAYRTELSCNTLPAAIANIGGAHPTPPPGPRGAPGGRRRRRPNNEQKEGEAGRKFSAHTRTFVPIERYLQYPLRSVFPLPSEYTPAGAKSQSLAATFPTLAEYRPAGHGKSSDLVVFTGQ